jgi:hypothetical protein
MEAITSSSNNNNNTTWLSAVDPQGNTLLHALFTHVGTASMLPVLLEKILAISHTTGIDLDPDGCNNAHTHTQGSMMRMTTPLKLCAERALSSPEALVALRRLLEVRQQQQQRQRQEGKEKKRDGGETSLLSHVLLLATRQQQQRQQQKARPGSSSRRAGGLGNDGTPSAPGGGGGGTGGGAAGAIPLSLEVLSAIIHASNDTLWWDATWRDPHTHKSQGQLLAALAPPLLLETHTHTQTAKAIVYNKIVRAALAKGILVPRS